MIDAKLIIVFLLSAIPFLIASSCAFASPVGTPPNTLVLGPGHYRFMDYVKAGGGLIFVCLVVSIIVIPIVWPFFPGK